MQSKRRLLLAAPWVLVFAAGCASTDRGLKARVDPMVGRANQEQMIERFGEPIDKKRIDGNTDVWEFVVAETSVPTGGNAGNIRTSTRLRATFKNGVLSAWSSYNAVR